MVTLSAINPGTDSLQSALNRARIEQARRQADQSEANARDLRAQADQEERLAQQGQRRVRELSSSQDSTYDRVLRNGNEGSELVPFQYQNTLERLYRITRENFEREGNASEGAEAAAPVVNSQGQTTGRIVNVSA